MAKGKEEEDRILFFKLVKIRKEENKTNKKPTQSLKKVVNEE